MTRGSHDQLHAVIFDVDGTLAETERDGHRQAFNLAFRDFGLPYEWGVAEYGTLLATTGGRHRLQEFLTRQGRGDAVQLAVALHTAKTTHFLDWIRSGAAHARPGVHELMKDLHNAGITVGVATTGSRSWVGPLLTRLFGDIDFAITVCGEDVDHLKPHPQAYVHALDRLGLDARQAVAVEDSPPGLSAATAAGLRCLVVPSAYNRNEDFPTAVAVVPGYLAMDLFDAPVPAYLRQGVTAAALVRLHATPERTQP